MSDTRFTLRLVLYLNPAVGVEAATEFARELFREQSEKISKAVVEASLPDPWSGEEGQ